MTSDAACDRADLPRDPGMVCAGCGREASEHRGSAQRQQLGERIRNLRKERNLSQRQLGDMAGVTNVMVSAIENGKSMPGVFTFVDLAKALGVSYGVLFGEPLALAEHAVAQVRDEVRALGYDLALIPREDRL